MTPAGPTSALKATGLLLVACLCWGLSFPLARALSIAQESVAGSDSWGRTAWGLGLRFTVAAVLLALWLGRSLAWPTAAEWRQGLGLGLTTAGGMLLQMDALSYTSASTCAFLTQGSAAWIPLFAALATRRWPSLRVVLCVVAVLAGIGLLAGVDLRTLRIARGELEALLCSLVFSVQILWAERPAYAANRSLLVALVTFVVAALAFVPVLFATAPTPAALGQLYADPAQLTILVLLATVSTGLGMILMFRYQRFVGATTAAIIYGSEPLWATIFAGFLPALVAPWLGITYLNEQLSTALLVGGGLILAANLGMAWRRQPATQPAAGG